MTPETPPSPGRIVGQVVLFWLLSLGLAWVFFLGGRPWTGFVALLAVSAVFQVHVSRRPWSALGLPLRAMGPVEWAVGALAGLALFGAAFAVIAGAGGASIRYAHPDPVGLRSILLVLAALALLEELIFRGYPLQALLRIVRPLPALAALSALFAVVHMGNPSSGWLPFVETFLAGMLLGGIVVRWGSLWAAWGLHFAWNAAQGPLFGLSVSGLTRNDLGPSLYLARLHGPAWLTGGGYGIEGSVAALAVTGAAAWAVLFWPHAPSLADLTDGRLRDDSSKRGREAAPFKDNEGEVSPEN